jgi:hypothetical protein
MSKISEALTFGLTVRESATDGSDFTNPVADYRRLFLGEDGQLHVKDAAGTVTDIGSGTGIAATLLDAKGDIIAASAADTAAKVTVGANGTVLEAASGAAAGVQWDYPPGYELDYVEITSPVSVTATTEGTANTCVTGSAVTYDGSTVVMIEVYTPNLRTDTTTAVRNIAVALYDGSSSIGFLGFMEDNGVDGPANATLMRRRLTPSAASHTYSARAWVNAGTGTFGAGAGGSGAYMPAYIRITKV